MLLFRTLLLFFARIFVLGFFEDDFLLLILDLCFIKCDFLIVSSVEELKLRLEFVSVDDFVTFRGDDRHLWHRDDCKLRVHLVQALLLLSKDVTDDAVE